LARAVTDGILRAYLEDVVVAPDFRNAGLGRTLIAAILDPLKSIPVITLHCRISMIAVERIWLVCRLSWMDRLRGV